MKTTDTGILLHAEGSAFRDGRYDLRSLELVVSNYRQIIDHALPLVVGQKSLTDRLKREVKYDVEIREGSVEVLLEFLLEHPEMFAVLAADGGYMLAEAISKVIKGAIDLRRALTKILEGGSRPSIHIDNSLNVDNSVTYDIKTGDIHLNNPQFIVAADETKAPFDRLIRGINGLDITNVSLAHKDVELDLTSADVEITGTSKEELDQHIEVVGRLDMVAFTPHRAQIITGNKRYPATWGEELRQKIRKFVDRDGVAFRVRPIVDRRKFGGETVGFHVIDCWEPQTRLNLA